MIAVIFESWPAEGRGEQYLALAAALRADLEAIDGFISVERFESLATPGKLLSLSFFRDEAAVAAWRFVKNVGSERAELNALENYGRSVPLVTISQPRTFELKLRVKY